MGLLSSLFKGFGRAVQTIRDLPGKITRWDLSRDIRRSSKPTQTVTDIPVVVDDRRHKKRHVSAGAPVNAELEALRKQNADLLKIIRNGGKIGNAKASNDPTKFDAQQRVADAIDAERENSGAEPGTPEWEEARARALDKIRAADLASEFVDHSDPDTMVTLDLTDEEKAALDLMGDTPWEAL